MRFKMMSLLLLSFAFFRAHRVFAATNANSCSSMCSILSRSLGGEVVLSYTNFSQSLGAYYSAQEEDLGPFCAVVPATAEDVSAFLKEVNSFDDSGYLSCPFAIKGGGHMPNSGAANIDGGITISLEKLTTIMLNKDKSAISIGAGSKWADVYGELTPLNLSVAGSRNGNVGAGGFLTGGGISYFAPQVGFACNSVVNFVVVLADGSIVSANAGSNIALWKALRGGSNNFGVVVRFDMAIFKQSSYLGGNIYSLFSTYEDQIDAFANINNATQYDVYTSIILTFSWDPRDSFIIANNLAYTQDGSCLSRPPTNIKAFLEIPSLASTMRTSNISDFVNELTESGSPLDGLRNLFATATFRSDAAFMKHITSLWNTTVTPLMSSSLVSAGLTFEPLPIITEKSIGLHVNSLGVNAGDGNLVIMQLSFSWTSSADDIRITDASRALVQQTDEAAESQGLYNQWKYLNYAATFQGVIQGYGHANARSLQATSREYDPKGLFQRCVPGGFKLFT